MSVCVCCHGGSICDSFETFKSFLRVGGGVQAGGEQEGEKKLKLGHEITF